MIVAAKNTASIAAAGTMKTDAGVAAAAVVPVAAEKKRLKQVF